MAREMARVSLSFRDRAAFGRQAARDFEFLDGGRRHDLRNAIQECRVRTEQNLHGAFCTNSFCKGAFCKGPFCTGAFRAAKKIRE
jgi:hypothetical protein